MFPTGVVKRRETFGLTFTGGAETGLQMNADIATYQLNVSMDTCTSSPYQRTVKGYNISVLRLQLASSQAARK